MKTPVSYYGGKQRLAKRIVGMMPEHSTYVEPFFGGGAVFFSKPKSQIEFINDLDQDLITMYRVMQDKDKADKFLRMVEYTPHAEAEHERAKKILKEKSSQDDVLIAWAYFVNSQQSFANICHGGWSRNKSSMVSSIGMKLNNKKTLLYLAIDRLTEVQISCENAFSLIDRFDDDQCFIFLDPPYPGTEQGYSHNGFTSDHMQKLVDLLDTKKNKFILTMYDCGVSTPKNWGRKEIDVLCTSKPDRKGKKKETRTEVILYRS